MKHTHIDGEGRFQSDRHPELEPDHILLDFSDPEARPALAALALAYNNKDHQLASDVRERLRTIVLPTRSALRRTSPRGRHGSTVGL